MLDRVLRDQPRMERGAAGDDEHLVDLAQDVGVGVQLVQREQTLLVDPADQRVPDRRGLLVDLLQHEVVEAALLGARHVPLHLEGLDLDLVAVEVRDANVVGPHLDHLVLVDRQDGPRLLQHRGDVGREDVLAVAEPDDQRRRDAGRPTMTSGSSSARTTSAYAPSSSRTAARTRSASDPSFSSIRWATTSVSVSESRTWPRFSSPVRRSVKFSMIPLWITATRPPAVEVGVRVPVGRRAVGRPPRVPHPDRARDGADDLERGVELGQLAGPLHDREAAVDHRDAGRVVPAVFETSQTLEDDRERLVGAHVAHDAAHEVRG